MKIVALVLLVIMMGLGVAYAEGQNAEAWLTESGKKSATTVTVTTKSAVENTANVAQTSMKDTISTPKVAIEAVKDTTNTALVAADKALKTITGEER